MLLRQILVPTDFSRNNSHAINYACDLAKLSKARLHLVHVVRNDLTDQIDEVARLGRLGAMMDGRAELEIDTVKNVVSGQPAQVIIEYAQEHEIDMIVMGTHGRTGLAHLTMGSVAEHVLRDAPCPVLVLGPRDGENASLNKAAQTLAEMIGEGLEGNIEVGRGSMQTALVEQLRIPATTAILLFDELEERDWLRYEDTKWIIVDGTELVDDVGAFVPDFSTETPATDLIKRAKKLRATDIHIDPVGNDQHRVRFRIDGALREYCRLHGSLANQIISRFKTLAGVDIADPFRPQEASLRLSHKFANLDVRMTAIPVAGGNAIALRLFDAEAISLPLSHLGFSDQSMTVVQDILKLGEGLVLVTGPSGSGKTTTVYSMLQSLDGDRKNIVSIEDPVEFSVPFVRQMSVDTIHGVTLSEGLRVILRTDPDVVFIGEIRDAEAANIGIRAASSGKYVFSTMHTRDIASTITSLRDIQIDKRSIASNVSGIVNQRLVRRLCEDCREGVLPTDAQREKFQSFQLEVPDMLFQPVGCVSCNGTGYHGRIGIFEVAAISAEIRDAITSDKSETEIEALLRSSATPSLERDALKKAGLGGISYEEATSIRWLA